MKMRFLSGRRSRILCGFATLAASIASSVSAQDAAIGGVWRIEKPVDAVRTTDGQAPPLTVAAANSYQSNRAARRGGDTSYDNATWCSSPGMPRLMLMNSPFEIVYSSPYVVFMHEWDRWARIVYLDGALREQPAAAGAFSVPPPPDGGAPGGPPPGGAPPGAAPGGPPSGGGPAGGGPPMMGDANGPIGLSTGKWEGKALVVETHNLRPTTLIDNSGLPHTEALKLTEHLTMRGPDVLEDRIRFDDPGVFTRPWETVVTYRRASQPLKEDVCLDRIKRGERAVR